MSWVAALMLQVLLLQKLLEQPAGHLHADTSAIMAQRTTMHCTSPAHRQHSSSQNLLPSPGLKAA